MTVPVGSSDVDFDIAYPNGLSNTDAGLGKIGACIMVEETRVVDSDRLPVGGEKGTFKQTVLPKILEEGFVDVDHDGRSSNRVGSLVEEVFHFVEETTLGFGWSRLEVW